jgi:hypothetical protein
MSTGREMRKLLGVMLGMLSALVIWQAIMAFFGTALIINGIYAGCSLLAFGVTMFGTGGVLVQPRREDDE